MGEEGIGIEALAYKIGLTNSETRNWIWSRDLTLKELVRLLDAMDVELWPLMKSRRIRRN
jgi:hypothetical protein